MSSALLTIAGEGCLFLDSDGRYLSVLESDPIAKAEMPSMRKDGMDVAHLSRYYGTDFIQWFGRKRDGAWYPSGRIMRLTAAGKRRVSAAAAEAVKQRMESQTTS